MKLKRLEVVNFLGIKEAAVEFGAKVSVFFGENGQGKSSVADAIEWAFTGKCRGVDKVKDVGELGNEDGVKPVVRLEYEYKDEDESVVRNVKNVRKNVSENPVIEYCLNPIRFLELSSNERAKVLVKVRGDKRKKVGEVLKKVVKEFKCGLATAIKDEGIDVFDVDGLRDGVVDLRRGYKRLVNELDCVRPTIEDFGLVQPNEDDCAFEDLGDKLVQIREGVLSLEARRIHRKSDDSRDGLIAELREGEGRLVAEIERIEVPECDDDLQWWLGLQELMEEWSGREEHGDCPICCGQINDFDVLKSGFDERYEVVREKVVAYNSAKREVDELKKKKNQVVIKIANIPESHGEEMTVAELEVIIREQKEEVRIVGEMSMGYVRFGEAIKSYAKNADKVAGLRETIGECNRVDDLLKDGGEVCVELNKMVDRIPIDRELFYNWGLTDLQLYDNGVVEVNGRDVKLASESERYRAAAVLGLALSHVGKVGFVCLDGYEVLIGVARKTLFRMIGKCVNEVENVLVFISSDKDWKEVPRGMELFEVKGGEVFKK